MLNTALNTLLHLKEQGILLDETYFIEESLTIMNYFLAKNYKDEVALIEDLHHNNNLLTQADRTLILNAVKQKLLLISQPLWTILRNFAEHPDYTSFYVLKQKGITAKDMATFIEFQHFTKEALLEAYEKEQSLSKRKVLKLCLGTEGEACDTMVTLHQINHTPYAALLTEYSTDPSAFIKRYSELNLAKEKVKVKTQSIIKDLDPVKNQFIDTSKKAWTLTQATTLRIKEKSIPVIKKGVKRANDLYKTFITLIKQPKVIKYSLIAISLILMISLGCLGYKDSLKYRLPETAQLESFAKTHLNGTQPGITNLSLDATHKVNRKNYTLNFTGIQQLDNCQLTYKFQGDYTYTNDNWEMSKLHILDEQVTNINKEVDEATMLADLLELAGTQQSFSNSSDLAVESINFQRKGELRDLEGDYTFTIQIQDNLLGYRLSGECTYRLNSDFLWELNPDNVILDIKENGYQQTPQINQIIDELTYWGIKVKDLGTIYLSPEHLQVDTITLETQGDKVLAVCKLQVNLAYLNGTMEVSVPFTVQDKTFIPQASGPITSVNAQVTYAPLFPQIVTQEELLTFFAENTYVTIYDPQQDRQVGYNLEDTQIQLGERMTLDFTSDDQKVSVSYLVKVKAPTHEIDFTMHIPYKVMFEELLIQFRLAEYTDLSITTYPITAAQIKKDMMNRYLSMESTNGIVDRFTQEGVDQVEIISESMEDNHLTFRTMVSFSIKEDDQIQHYVGEYDVIYRRDTFDYQFVNIEFID